MSSPAQASPPSSPAETGFDPLVFWLQHRRTVGLFAALFFAALLVYFAAEYLRTSKQEASARALSSATDANGYRKVMQDYSGTAAAGDAALLLAARLREDGKPDEAASTLRAFIERSPDHPLISGAWTSLAACQEAQGKADEALSTYQKVSTTYSTSFSAPVALLGQARIFGAKGKADEANRLLDQVINQFPETIFAQQASREKQLRKK